MLPLNLMTATPEQLQKITPKDLEKLSIQQLTDLNKVLIHVLKVAPKNFLEGEMLNTVNQFKKLHEQILALIPIKQFAENSGIAFSYAEQLRSKLNEIDPSGKLESRIFLNSAEDPAYNPLYELRLNDSFMEFLLANHLQSQQLIRYAIKGQPQAVKQRLIGSKLGILLSKVLPVSPQTLFGANIDPVAQLLEELLQISQTRAERDRKKSKLVAVDKDVPAVLDADSRKAVTIASTRLAEHLFENFRCRIEGSLIRGKALKIITTEGAIEYYSVEAMNFWLTCGGGRPGKTDQGIEIIIHPATAEEIPIHILQTADEYRNRLISLILGQPAIKELTSAQQLKLMSQFRNEFGWIEQDNSETMNYSPR